MYHLLMENDLHRRVYAGLIDEAFTALSGQRVELMDPVSSPFGVGFKFSRSLLLLPSYLFPLALRFVLYWKFSIMLNSLISKDSPYCDITFLCRSTAPFFNGEVVRIGFENEVATPINQELLEILSARTHEKRDKSNENASIIRSALPVIYSDSQVILGVSIIVLLVAVLVGFVGFVVNVMLYW